MKARFVPSESGILDAYRSLNYLGLVELQKSHSLMENMEAYPESLMSVSFEWRSSPRNMYLEALSRHLLTSRHLHFT
jgi:hypothetical protein